MITTVVGELAAKGVAKAAITMASILMYTALEHLGRVDQKSKNDFDIYHNISITTTLMSDPILCGVWWHILNFSRCPIECLTHVWSIKYRLITKLIA